MADAAPPSPPLPAMQSPSNASPPPPSSPPADTPTPAAAKTPDLPDTPAFVDPNNPASDADAFAVASSDAAADAPGDAEDDGINALGARKHMTLAPPAPPSKKSKKKNNSNNIWTRPASRKGKKKAKQPAHAPTGANGSRHPKPSCGEGEFFLTPAPRLAAEHNDGVPALPVLLSRVFKSERIELSDDRLTAGSTKGFRMIREPNSPHPNPILHHRLNLL